MAMGNTSCNLIDPGNFRCYPNSISCGNFGRGILCKLEQVSLDCSPDVKPRRYPKLRRMHLSLATKEKKMYAWCCRPFFVSFLICLRCVRFWRPVPSLGGNPLLEALHNRRCPHSARWTEPCASRSSFLLFAPY